VSQAKQPTAWPKGTIITDKTLLQDLITNVHPQFPGFSDEAKERALVFIAKMNPYVKVIIPVESGSAGKASGRITYIVESDKPILIPLYKFIAE
jgi:hypothetical protein